MHSIRTANSDAARNWSAVLLVVAGCALALAMVLSLVPGGPVLSIFTSLLFVLALTAAALGLVGVVRRRRTSSAGPRAEPNDDVTRVGS